MQDKEKLAQLRAELAKQGLDGFVIPMNDAFQSEYVPDSDKRIGFLTGFTGSAGTVVVLKDKAAFFTDGRYTLQAAEQVDNGLYSLHDSTELSPQDWVREQMQPGEVLGVDSWLHTEANAKSYQKACSRAGALLQTVTHNPVDAIWHERPNAPLGQVYLHDIGYAGETALSKRERLARTLQASGVDATVLTLADSICWLLNIRGSDVHCTPFALAYAFLHRDGTVDLFIDESKLSVEVRTHIEAKIYSPNSLESYINTLENKKIQSDPYSTPLWFFAQLEQAGAAIIRGEDICQLPKACKNKTEQQGAIAAHIKDGVAVVEFLCWLDKQIGRMPVSEISVAEQLLLYRQKQEGFVMPSFDTIAGFGAHGAIIHYHTTEKSNIPIENNGLLLLDSGGQYREGTTDITRTIAIGSPTEEQIRRFTQVLKGHIMLAMAKFPQGTTGTQLDALARYALWQECLDYGHGTGHGVGSYLSVHEGPARISKMPNTIALQPGMILSNEPGYYKAGAYGIRIESLLLVEESREMGENSKKFLQFNTLTRVPIDKDLIDTTLLTVPERAWLNQYHQQIYADILPYCHTLELHKWLEEHTSSI